MSRSKEVILQKQQEWGDKILEQIRNSKAIRVNYEEREKKKPYLIIKHGRKRRGRNKRQTRNHRASNHSISTDTAIALKSLAV